MSLAPKTVKCHIDGNPQRHYFDIVENKDIAICVCRCKQKMNGFPGSELNVTKVVTYKSKQMVRFNS